MQSRCATSIRRPLPMKRRLIFIFVYIVFVCGLVTLAATAYWQIRSSPATSGRTDEESIWLYYYGELKQSGDYDAESSLDDESFDVLLLGASVLEQVANELETRLHERLGGNVRVFNLARSAHTSRDSFLKYKQLTSQQFDVVVMYHGINDTRMNCCPQSEFKDDYTHCYWYRGMKRRVAAGRLSLAGLIQDDMQSLIPLGEPEPESLDLGRTIKTGPAFRANLEGVVHGAKDSAQPVLMMTFAYHVPGNYSRTQFEAGRLDYGPGKHQLPIELWGRPDNVARTIDVHNGIVDELASKNDHVVLVDQHSLMPKDGEHFSDPCHLTEAGVTRFVENMLPAIVDRWESAMQSRQ